MAETVRVCILAGRYAPEFTGHGIQIHRSLPHLLAEGIAPTVIAFEPPPELAWSAGDDPAPVHRILDRGEGPLSTLRRLISLRRHLRRHHGEYDVVHSINQGLEFTLNLPYLDRVGLPALFEMVLLGSDDPVSISRYAFGATKLRLMRRLAAWTGITNAFRPSIREAGVPEERFHCVHTGVDLERFRPVAPEARRSLRGELGLPPDGRVVVTAGALIHRKGMDRLLDAWQALGPDPERDRLLVVGPATPAEGLPYDDPTPRSLRAQADAPGVAGTVMFTGRVDDLERYYAASDLFVFLSRREGLGNVTIEAMATGLPCIVSPLDGIGHELIDHGRTGFVAESPDDAAAVAALIRRLLDQPDEARRMGEAAHADAVARFSMPARAAALATLYRELASAV